MAGFTTEHSGTLPQSRAWCALLVVATALSVTSSRAGIVTTTDESGSGSLREAIADAVPGETITFDSSLSGATIKLILYTQMVRPSPDGLLSRGQAGACLKSPPPLAIPVSACTRYRSREVGRPEQMEEIFRYDGETDSPVEGIGFIHNASSISIIDPNPPGNEVFYRFEAERSDP